MNSARRDRTWPRSQDLGDQMQRLDLDDLARPTAFKPVDVMAMRWARRHGFFLDSVLDGESVRVRPCWRLETDEGGAAVFVGQG